MAVRGIVMADILKTAEQFVRRACECHRLEEQLLALAYQEIWPVLRKQSSAKGATTKSDARRRVDAESRRA